MTHDLANRLVALVQDLTALDAEGSPREITIDTPFREAGIDSLRALQIVVFVERETGRDVPEDRIGKFKNIRTILDYLNDNQGSQA